MPPSTRSKGEGTRYLKANPHEPSIVRDSGLQIKVFRWTSAALSMHSAEFSPAVDTVPLWYDNMDANWAAQLRRQEQSCVGPRASRGHQSGSGPRTSQRVAHMAHQL